MPDSLLPPRSCAQLAPLPLRKNTRQIVTFTGHTPKTSASFDVSGTGDVTVPEVTLTKSTGNLKEVVVAARKPMVEVKADKTILNVEGTINSVGQDALDPGRFRYNLEGTR